MQLSLKAFCQQSQILAEPKVDERVELLSIAFRLADSEEYSSKRYSDYVKNIDEHFSLYKDHNLIKYIKNVLRENGVGFDAVMFMAISLSDTYPFRPLKPFSNDFPDERWGVENANHFLILLNEFYVDSNAKDFFKSNQNRYEIASKRFNKVYNELDLKWYENFYGEGPKGEFRIVNGLGNGGGNYGPNIKLNDKETIYAIMGTWSVDSLGTPNYSVEDYFPTLLHEFNHSFVNHVVEIYHDSLENSGSKLFEVLKDQMEDQAYDNWQIMYSEAVVRAAVIKYLKDHQYQAEFIQSELNEEMNRGFFWTDKLVLELDRYDKNRNVYPTLESFMPEIIVFFDSIANNIQELEKDLDKKRPKVISLEPFINGSENVDWNIKKMKVVFDKPLIGKGYSINTGPKGDDAYPEIGEIYYSEDKKSVILELELLPEKEYQFVLTGMSFKSEEGIGMKNYVIDFKTKKE